MFGPHPSGNAPIVTPGSWGQGQRGAAGYEDHGESELNIPRVTPEKFRDIMTKDPVCCLSSDPVSAAAELMREHDVGVLPVVMSQSDKKMVGIITDRDLVVRLVAGERDPTSIDRGRDHDPPRCDLFARRRVSNGLGAHGAKPTEAYRTNRQFRPSGRYHFTG